MHGEFDTSAVVEGLPVQALPICALKPGDSPRSSGQDADHVNMLAQTDAPLPPIVVHGPSMRIVDGMHRVDAARQRGDREIDARIFDGDEDTAFLLAVRANTTHGLPLTLADRNAAAERILGSHPWLSDRAVADLTGLAAATVAAVRQRLDLGQAGTQVRLGRDGRVRPVNGADGRRLAAVLMSERPDASLREIAREAGISPTTVRDVRQRMGRGDSPVPTKQQAAERSTPSDWSKSRRDGPSAPVTPRDPMLLLQHLRRDPSLRFSDTGRMLLIWLTTNVTGIRRWPELLDQIPPHCTYLLVELARGCAETWSTFADELVRHSSAASEPPSGRRESAFRRDTVA